MRICLTRTPDCFHQINLTYKKLAHLGKLFLFCVLNGQATAYSIQMLDFLPQILKNAIKNINIKDVYELRLRANQPVKMNYRGAYCYLGIYGVTTQKNNALVATKQDIEDCVFKAGNCSVYSVEEQIKSGFITAKNGERIGLAGEYVLDNGKPLTIRNFSSLCIRIPHNVEGCGSQVFHSCLENSLQNVLICSAPGLGKTTILRDLARQISKVYPCNLLVCDERGEICAEDIEENIDVLKFCYKEMAFDAGIRAMRPDVIITDELSIRDIAVVERAIHAGIVVLASAHFSNFEDISPQFLELFSRFVILDRCKIGNIKAVYNPKGERCGI